MRALEHFVGGKSVPGSSGREAPVYDPARGVQTATVPFASADEVGAAVDVATEAAAEWGAGSLSSRAAVLFRFRDLVAAATADLAAAVTAEHGKVLSDAAGEVARGLENIEFACGIPHLLKGSHSTEVSTGVDVHTVLEPKLQIGAVFGGEGRNGERDSGKVDPLVLAQLATINHLAFDVFAAGANDTEFDQPVGKQDARALFDILSESFECGAHAGCGTQHVPGSDGETAAGLEQDGLMIFQLRGADFERLQVA